jgi:hypothetical protein
VKLIDGVWGWTDVGSERSSTLGYRVQGSILDARYLMLDEQ